MASEMEMRVARVLRAGRGCHVDQEFPCPFCLWPPDENTAAFDETGCVWLARAAIETMREPTDDMLKAATDATYRAGYILEADATWPIMIDAALLGYQVAHGQG